MANPGRKARAPLAARPPKQCCLGCSLLLTHAELSLWPQQTGRLPRRLQPKSEELSGACRSWNLRSRRAQPDGQPQIRFAEKDRQTSLITTPGCSAQLNFREKFAMLSCTPPSHLEHAAW